MIEIIILPYMAVSFAIGWAVFSPFSSLEDLDSLTFEKLTTIDILASFLPLCVMLSLALAANPKEASSTLLLVLLGVAILGFTIGGLAIGLFLLSKLQNVTSLKRIAINGVVIPFGSLLAIAWFVIPIWASSYSIFLSMPAMLALPVCVLALRAISDWACDRPPLTWGGEQF